MVIISNGQTITLNDRETQSVKDAINLAYLTNRELLPVTNADDLDAQQHYVDDLEFINTALKTPALKYRTSVRLLTASGRMMATNIDTLISAVNEVREIYEDMDDDRNDQFVQELYAVETFLKNEG